MFRVTQDQLNAAIAQAVAAALQKTAGAISTQSAVTLTAAQSYADGTASPKAVIAATVLRPAASATPANNGDMLFEATSNTTITLKYKGSDGVVRSYALTPLAP